MKHARFASTAVLVLGAAGASLGRSGCGTFPFHTHASAPASPVSEPAAPAAGPGVTDPWAVVSAYYGA